MNVKTNKSNKQYEQTALAETTLALSRVHWYTPLTNLFSTVFSYGYAGLKVLDVTTRILTAGALYLNLDQVFLRWGSAFLAATAIWEIVIALMRVNGPNREQ